MVRRLILMTSMVLIALVLVGGDAKSEPSRSAPVLDDYKHFRVLSMDLLGRMPTRAEVAAFERPDFDEGAWIEAHLEGAAYAERLTRVYMDLLRLEPNVTFSTGPDQLYRQEVTTASGKGVYVYFRAGQRRAREAVDGEFCLTEAESGLVVRANAATLGTAKRVPDAVLERATTLVHPWWLYRDYRAPQPMERYGQGWRDPDPQYRPVESLLQEPDGKPTEVVRVCREEAETRSEGHVFARGVARPLPATGKLPVGRTRPAPQDTPYAKEHAGQSLACDTKTALSLATDCGCGVGLERCMPNEGVTQANAFYYPARLLPGSDLPLDAVKQQSQRWFPYWWSRETVHFLDDLFATDRDFREILTGRHTFVNGPLAQFYRDVQRGNCCGPEQFFGMVEEAEPLFEPKNVPRELLPQDTGHWTLVADRGPHAAGILTMPMFLEKYASARARGAVLYNAFLCRSFVASSGPIAPSDEPNLMKRPGCQTCHETLEPLAAYFARIEPSSFVFLPSASFPLKTGRCKKGKDGKMSGACSALYDPAFADEQGAVLRSAYGSPPHADLEVTGAAQDVTRAPEFASCAVERVTASFLGRPVSVDDAPLLASLTQVFVTSGYRPRALVRAILRSSAYAQSNGVVALPSPKDGP